MTTVAKKLGGPLQLIAAVAVGGYVVLRTTEAGVKLGINKIKDIKEKQKSDFKEKPYYTVNSQGVNNEGVNFNIGDKFQVLEVDRDAVLIEISGNENNPYFASLDFLKSISDYTNEFITSDTRKSTPERLFEQYCEGVDAIDWVYKNGDAGQQYFSIVYQDGFSLKQWLFYPDYIVKMKDGTVWIIETKGGMQAGHTKNIDIQVQNKFTAFKDYAKRYGVQWGVVRDIDDELYINNTVYTDDMSGDNWVPLEDVLK